MRQSLGSSAPFAGFVALVVAGSEFTLLAIGGTSWAVVAGVIAMRLFEPSPGTASR